MVLYYNSRAWLTGEHIKKMMRTSIVAFGPNNFIKCILLNHLFIMPVTENSRSSAVEDIDNTFFDRLTRPDRHVGRPVNPFAKISSQTVHSIVKESDALRPEITAFQKLGTEYQGRVVENRESGGNYLETYTVQHNPKAGLKLYATQRMPVEHTREK
ncbi:FirrV-1-B57 [Feldmannia irregularis virus a]|uniref:FirrV-1-B57 n=1 Tax=Feldmannia irregularis virus a TaxID=231992 RepID=Q6XLX9_9PHYC|nr:FirrV-1-B57 [Feldmannia irregularis virus a]AAR26932.1 FirrV-1-B57 [Feldmannia irregularis virus a]